MTTLNLHLGGTLRSKVGGYAFQSQVDQVVERRGKGVLAGNSCSLCVSRGGFLQKTAEGLTLCNASAFQCVFSGEQIGGVQRLFRCARPEQNDRACRCVLKVESGETQ